MHRVKPFMILVAVAAVLSLGSVASAAITTLQFDPNDMFNYATSNDTRLNQQGTARFISGPRTDIDGLPTGRYYQTYNDGISIPRMTGATAEQDLTSVANILSFGGKAGYQGVSWIQLYLQGGSANTWGEKVVLNSGSMTMSVNGEYDWTASLSGATPTYTTVLGGEEGHQNAFSPTFNPAEELFSVSGDFFVDEDGSGGYSPGDTNLVAGRDYTIWFYAKLNNWHYVDGYDNDAWGSPGYIEGTITATAVPAVPEPASLAIWVLLASGCAGVAVVRRRRRGATGTS